MKRLVGFQLLSKIKLLYKGRYDVLKYEGNIWHILVECGYIRANDETSIEKRTLRAFGYFCNAYWHAL